MTLLHITVPNQDPRLQLVISHPSVRWPPSRGHPGCVLPSLQVPHWCFVICCVAAAICSVAAAVQQVTELNFINW